MKKVLLIFGGNSKEHDISCKSILNIIDNIDKNKFICDYVGITKDNRWIKCSKQNIIKKNWYKKKEIKNIITFVKKYDVVFPIIHGTNGEDGRLQGLLELFNIKFVGCHTLSSAIGMDKEATKIYLNGLNIPQVPYIKYNNNLDEIMKLKFPLIVKPCNGGSSIGISKVNNKEELIKGINEALVYDKDIIVEKFIRSQELECSVMEGDKLIVSDIGEIKCNNEFYDYEDKYINNTKLIIPADISEKIRNKIKNYSFKIFKGIKGCGLCRIDFLYDLDNKKLYLNEINTMPGFTDISMYPMLIKNCGFSYQEIITNLINKAK